MRKRGRPALLSREQIVAAALEFDLETLTMRRLAQRLGVTHSTLYGWVTDRAELLELISAVTIDKIVPADAPVDDDWRTWLAGVAWRIRTELMSAPGHASRLAHHHDDAAHDHLHARVVSALTDAGLEPEHAYRTWAVFGVSVLGWVAAEQNEVADPSMPRRLPDFGYLLDTLLRGLPPQSPYPQPH